MKYIPYTIWLVVTAALCLTVLPAILIYNLTEWFEIGDKILES
jgi:hypothetical protein